ncbi:MAG: RNA polymerase sigma-70 factor [Crocinitomicaceae bacterium]|nr:RNA polymerase sigma-70 factor [Crocinitomicaceae bacterium]
MTPINHYDEKDLLLRLQGGDHNAFEMLYKKYSLTIYTNILRMVRDEDIADDLLHDLFLKIWNKRVEIDPENSFKGYLFTCSRFLVLNFLRHVSVERQVEKYLSSVRTELYTHIEELVFLKETDNILQNAIGQLPPQRQKIYTMCKVDGMSYVEVASLLGISISTVQDHIVKANQFIKKQLSTTDNLTLLLGALLITY